MIILTDEEAEQLRTLYTRLLAGDFYADYDRAVRMVDQLRRIVMFKGSGPCGVVPRKLSDPEAAADVAALQAEMVNDPQKAKALLRAAGIITDGGALAPEFGGPPVTANNGS